MKFNNIIKVILIITLLYLFLNNFVFKNKKMKESYYNKHEVYYKGAKYDIAPFIHLHPGGSVILRSLGKDLKKVWKENGVSWHNSNPNVMRELKKLKI